MPDRLAYRIQETCCDATSPNISEGLSFFLKSSYHNLTDTGKVRVDFSLHVLKKPAQPLGIWRCRVNFWFSDTDVTVDDEQGFEYFKQGYCLALESASEFVKDKYKLHNINETPADEELMTRYKAILEKKRQKQ